MLMITIKESIKLIGDGLHTGRSCEVLIEPCMEFGIFFKNVDTGITELVSEKTLFGSMLGSNFVFEHDRSKKIMTVEHLLSTLLLTGVTNAVITVTGCEMPIMDGSGKDFSDAIIKSGTAKIGSKNIFVGFSKPNSPALEKQCYKKGKITTTFEIRVGDKFIRISPRDDNRVMVNVSIAFDNKCVLAMPQTKHFDLFSDDPSLVISARTFGFKSDIDELLSMGLVLGGSMSNAILISDNQILNPTGLRFDDELVTHKLLDLIGDLSPIFYNFSGFDIDCFKCGHKINNEFLVEFSKIYKQL